ncbi:MAG: hypothetical protein JKX81_14875 [Arenicella sp.]|nr:hypothetical protein [Arenicella sp.]
MKRTIVVSTLMAIFLSGCANKVYFGTSTRLAIDFSSDGAGIGYKNSQMAIVPPKEDGNEFSVLGSSDIDISLSKIMIDEEFATGKAAEYASQDDGSEKDLNAAHGNLLFGAYTSVSIIDLNFGVTNPFQGATFGYKRATATIIPIVDDSLRSVYAKTSINSEPYDAETNPCGTKTDGLRFVQLFATGKAAVNMAKQNQTSLETVGSNDKARNKDVCGE